LVTLLEKEKKEKQKEKEKKKKHIKRVPLAIGLIFMLIRVICLIYVFASTNSVQATYATMTVAFIGFGLTELDKSGVLER
jgi:UDP-N-acetylmuramyl pentapeptide phosphotransferase/UDP-N-acetylglucosamine-1-phosphate transferase